MQLPMVTTINEPPRKPMAAFGTLGQRIQQVLFTSFTAGFPVTTPKYTVWGFITDVILCSGMGLPALATRADDVAFGTILQNRVSPSLTTILTS